MRNPIRTTACRSSRAILGFGAFLFAFAFTGCVGYVQGDGGGVESSGSDMFLFGGGYHDGGSSRDYGRRGRESRQPSGRAAGVPDARPAPAAPAAARSTGGRR